MLDIVYTHPTDVFMLVHILREGNEPIESESQPILQAIKLLFTEVRCDYLFPFIVYTNYKKYKISINVVYPSD